MALVSSHKIVATLKSVKTLLLLLALCHASNATADWSGFITEKTLLGRPYGQIASAGKLDSQNKLKVVCFQQDSFWLYLDSKGIDTSEPLDIVVSVDQLEPVNLTFRRIGENYTVTNRTPEFWKLIAQMSAGVVLKVTIGDGMQDRYSLKGFTAAYLDNCDWMDSANMYSAYLDRYQ